MDNCQNVNLQTIHSTSPIIVIGKNIKRLKKMNIIMNSELNNE